MTSKSTALTTKVASGSPYQLSSEQTLKASKALLTHIKASSASKPEDKKSLLPDDETELTDSPTIWLTLTTKKHIVDSKRLKPTKLKLPHSLNTSPTTTICIITADPQRTYKDIVASPAFPAELSRRITKVVGLEKLKKKFSQYEAQRKLFAEHDIFLADDRIVNLLPKILGKTFYKSTAKRPIPITIQEIVAKVDDKKPVREKGAKKTGAGTPKAIAAEIEKALSSAVINLSPTVSTSMRVGNSTMTAFQIASNVEAVCTQIIEKIVPQKWRNVKCIYIKGSTTAALPIWLADELWTNESDVLDDEAAEKLKFEQQANVGKKRKNVESVTAAMEGGEQKKSKKQKVLVESNDDTLDKEIAQRKERLRKQKADAAGDVENEVPKSTKKGKKANAVVA